jgi:phage tail sheath protein FI
MTFPISPGVYNREQDYSQSVPTLATSTAAQAGIFSWGPLFDPTFISTQKQLKETFGPATANNFETYMTAYNFLQYGQSLYIVRTANTTTSTVNSALNAVGGTTPSSADILNSVVLNKTQFTTELSLGNFPSNVTYVAKWPGAKGNSLLISQCESANQYHSNVAISGQLQAPSIFAGNAYAGVMTFVPGSNTANIIFTAVSPSTPPGGNAYANSVVAPSLTVGDIFKVSTGIRGNPTQYLQTTSYGNAVTNATVTVLPINFNKPFIGGSNVSVTGSVERLWQFYKNVTPMTSWISNTQSHSTNPTIADVLQLVVVDQNGSFSGVPNTVLEVYNNLSRATDAVNSDGTSNYYRNVINQNSQYIWNVNDHSTAISNTSGNLTAVTSSSVPYTLTLAGGQDGDNETNAPMQTLINGWSLFQGVENITIDFILAGKSVGSTATAGQDGTTYNNFGMANWLINNIAQTRRDCVVFFSPDRSIVLNNIGNEVTDLINWASLISPSTYAFMDNNYKYQYDVDNNVYRWVPFNGDVAGLCAYTDTIAYPWVSPAGFNRGIISNVTQLAYNAQEADRDLLYPKGINPVVSFPGRGTVLYGDRTFTIQSSGFDRLNVRRLFLVVERAVKAFAQNTLFELNDVFTQNQFKNQITPYLRTIVGSNGMSDFLIDCDNTINTATVADNEEFLCAIYIKPKHAINFIKLTYVNTPSGMSFSTIENVNL